MQIFPPVNEMMDEIRRDALEVIPEEDLERKLRRAVQTGEPLRVKQGFDPTRPDLHIGHAVSLRKLAALQAMGHEVIFVVGDYTARVGDPSGRNETRPRLAPDEIDANARTYAEQVGRLLDVARARIEYNSRWLAPLDLAAVLELTGSYTVARMLERDDFARRHAEGRPISIMEFLYPLMQAYDSVALAADIELGGTDQKFNLLVGRTIQERYGQEPQVALIMPLLRGTDGVTKMSKSYDNYVGVAEPPAEQYGKTMSIPDTLLEEWIRLCVPDPDEQRQLLSLQPTDPYAAKRRLARTVVASYHGEAAAQEAEAGFDRLFRGGETPADMPEVRVSRSDPLIRYNTEQGGRLTGFLVTAGLAASTSEAARLIEQGAVAVDGARVTDRNAAIRVGAEGVVLRKGKRHFAKVRVADLDTPEPAA
jgi:tyrosyl-tRNA synthetase